MKEKNTAKRDRTMLVAIFAVGGILLLVVALALFLPLFSARRAIRETTKAFECFGEEDTLVLADPYILQYGGFEKEAQVRLSGEEARRWIALLLPCLKEAHFDEAQRGLLGGGFDPSATVRREDGSAFAVYLREDEIYLADGDKRYVFEIHDRQERAYEELFGALEGFLAENVIE